MFNIFNYCYIFFFNFGSYTLIYDDEELLTVRNEGYTFEDITSLVFSKIPLSEALREE